MTRTDSISLSGVAPSKSYVAEIDFLRAISVLMVLICHLDINVLSGGFVGVDVFFVISGYVVTLSLFKREYRGIADFLFGFYSRRLLRIFPALIACVSVTALLTALFIPQSWLSEAVYSTGLYALFGFSNFALIWFNDGYFSPRSDFNPFTHTWSLGVEEQFYFIFPVAFILLLAPFVFRNWRPKFGLAVMGAAFAISLAYAWHLGNVDPQAAYYLLASRWWELAAGVMLAVVHINYSRLSVSSASQPISAILGLAMIVVAGLFADPGHFPFPWALLPVAGAVTFLHAVGVGEPLSGKLGRGLRLPPMLYVGRISYSLYLWHWPFIVLFRWTVGIEGPIQIVTALVLSFAVAALSYHIVETPIRKLVHRKVRFFNARVIAVGLTTVVLAITAYNGIFNNRDAITLSVTRDQQAWFPYGYDRPSDYAGPRFAGHTLFAVGDSHLGAYEAMLNWTSKDLQVDLWRRGIDDCQLARLYYEVKDSEHCTALIESILTEIESLAKPGDIVFFPTLRTHRLVDQWLHFDLRAVRDFNASAAYRDRLAVALTENTPYFERLARLGVTILLDKPKPTMLTVPYRCADWFNRGNSMCSGGDVVSRELLYELRLPMLETLEIAAQQVPAIALWDPFPYLCPDAECGVYDATGPLFMDGDHLSGHGNQVLLEPFRAKLVELFERSLQSGQAVD